MPAEDQPAQEAEQPQIDGIRILPGTTNVLIVAPHGPYPVNPKTGKQEYKNDERTGLIAEAIQVETGWRTIINDAFVKPDKKKKEKPDFKAKRLDLFKIEQAEMVPGYLEAIKSAVDAHEGKTLVVWIHGMADGSAEDEKSELIKARKMKNGDGDLHALIGYGQGTHPRLEGIKEPKKEDKTHRYTAENPTVERFRDELTALGLRTLIARNEAPKFRGRDPERLNQWFLNQEYPPDKVQSVQIEIREKDFRETPEQCVETAKKIVKALKAIVAPPPAVVKQAPPPEPKVPEVVDPEQERAFKAFEQIKDIFNKHFHNAMLDAGRLIVNEFYGGSFTKAMRKEPEHEGSLRQLILMLQQNKTEAPSKTWVYDAVNLAVDEHRLSGFRTYGKIGHSHKVLLTHVSDLEKKKQLVEETARERFSVALLRERIKEVVPKAGADIDINDIPADDDLKTIPREKLDRLRAKLDQRIIDYQKALDKYKAEKERVDEALGQMEHTRAPKANKSNAKQAKPTAWPKVQIKNDAGDEVLAEAPLIVSASRRNDTPAHYADWFMARLRRGHLATKYRKVRYIAFNNTKFITFWTKNPAPMLPYLDELDKMGLWCYFQFTLNDYEKDIEPNIPPLQERIETFQAISARIGKERVVWRFDPLILSDSITKEALVEKVSNLFPILSPHTERLVISFLKPSEYEKVVRNLDKAGIKARDFSPDDVAYVAGALGTLGKKNNVQVQTCAVEDDLSIYGIGKGKCIDGDLFRRISNDDPALMEFLGNGDGPKDPGQRPLCGCIPSIDIGTTNTCPHLCPYCYSNVSEKAVKANQERLTGNGEFLVAGKSEAQPAGQEKPLAQ